MTFLALKERELKQMQTFKLENICKELVGKALVSLEYGSISTSEEDAEECGERYIPENSVIKDAVVSTTEGDRDPCIRLYLSDDIEVEVYSNEEITVV